MASRTKIPEMPVGLGVLDEEHADIQRRYVRLNRAILETNSLVRIRVAAELLAEVILLHLLHEEELLRKMSFPFLREHRDTQTEMMSELFKIELDLSRNETRAPMRLRDLCREWMNEHVHVERRELEIAVLAGGNQLGSIQA